MVPRGARALFMRVPCTIQVGPTCDPRTIQAGPMWDPRTIQARPIWNPRTIQTGPTYHLSMTHLLFRRDPRKAAVLSNEPLYLKKIIFLPLNFVYYIHM